MSFCCKPVKRADIVWSYAGVRPLFETGGGRDQDLSTLTRDYSFEIDRAEGGAPVLTVFGGKLTTHRRLAEHAMQSSRASCPGRRMSPSRGDILPGGDFGRDGMLAYQRHLGARHPYLPEAQLARYVKLYGTRSDILLQDVRSLADLGLRFGADLYEREV